MKTLSNFFKILNYKEKSNFIFLIFMLTIVALSEAVSIGSLIPLIKVILDPQYIDTLKQIFNFKLIYFRVPATARRCLPIKQDRIPKLRLWLPPWQEVARHRH